MKVCGLRLAVGAGCQYDEECQEGAFCSGPLGGFGSCKQFSSLGKPCKPRQETGDYVPCRELLSCYQPTGATGLCVLWRNPGEDCSGGLDCSDGANGEGSCLYDPADGGQHCEVPGDAGHHVTECP